MEKRTKIMFLAWKLASLGGIAAFLGSILSATLYFYHYSHQKVREVSGSLISGNSTKKQEIEE